MSRRLPLLALLLCACSPGVTALHRLPRGQADADFYALPFPSDLRLGPSGAFDLSAYPRAPGQLGLYVDQMDGRIQGAGPGAGIYFRFDGPLDAASLPQGAARSAAADSSAFLVDITPGSPTYGERAPVLARFHKEGGRFIGDNWLSLVPVPGLPLRERTTYAAILTTALRTEGGGPVSRDADLSLLLSAEPPAAAADRAAWERYAPLRAFAAERLRPSEIASATVFTTQHATALMHRLREAVYRLPEPAVEDLQYIRDHDGLCHIYHGSYRAPNFQTGEPPYLSSGGAIETDPDGLPLVSREERLRFALSVPNAPMPEGGWPVVLYAHGTGGDYESFVSEGIDLRAARVELGGKVLGRMAVISIDQVLHGPRDTSGAPVELTFFNLKNIAAARDNPRQGAADDFQLLRLVKRFAVAAAPATGRPIRFDPRRIYFVGHSQGGLTGPLFVAAEPEVRAAVFSGAGAVLVLSLLNKTEPTDIAALVESILQEEATPDHPLLNLLQAYFEVADPNNYGRLMLREPPPGSAPKSVYQSLGVTDHYTPVPNIKAFALSLGVQPVAPELTELEDLGLGDMRWTAAPVSGNVAGGRATGVLRQYQQREGSDGHFVLFDRLEARQDWSRFLASDIAYDLAQLP